MVSWRWGKWVTKSKMALSDTENHLNSCKQIKVKIAWRENTWWYNSLTLWLWVVGGAGVEGTVFQKKWPLGWWKRMYSPDTFGRQEKSRKRKVVMGETKVGDSSRCFSVFGRLATFHSSSILSYPFSFLFCNSATGMVPLILKYGTQNY